MAAAAAGALDYSCGHVVEGYTRFISGEKKLYTWSELQQIETHRRNILLRVDNSFWKILRYWNGTCLQVMVRDSLLWATLAIYVIVRVQKVMDTLPRYLEKLEETNIDIIGGFLSFFLVLFVNQANVRFNAMYKDSMSCKGKILDIASVVTLYFPPENASRLIRYLNAAHVAGYVGLASDTYSMRSFFTPLNDTYRFLTEQEVNRMNEIGMEGGDDCFRELLLWVIREIQTMQEEKLIDARMSGELREKTQQFRNTMGSMYDDKDQPIHFFYVHFLCLLTVFYLPIFAVVTAYAVDSDDEAGDDVNWVSEVVSGFIVFLQAVFVIGLRLLGQVMVDPYGDDYEDLSVLHYVTSTWVGSNRILKVKFPDVSDGAAIETEMERTRTANLGRAWDSKNMNAGSFT